MTHPQTLAKQLNDYFPNKELKQIADTGCCIFTLMWCLGIEPDDTHAIIEAQKVMNAGGANKVCLVYWADAIKFLSGRKMNVEFVDFTDLKVLKKYKGRIPVRFNYKGMTHWVGYEKGAIKFDPLEVSPVREKGLPTSARILTLI